MTNVEKKRLRTTGGLASGLLGTSHCRCGGGSRGVRRLLEGVVVDGGKDERGGERR